MKAVPVDDCTSANDTREAVRALTLGHPDRCNSAVHLRVLFAVPQGILSPGPRYRVFQYLNRYEAAGLACSVVVMQGRRSAERSLRNAHLMLPNRLLHYAVVWWAQHLLAARLLGMIGRFDRVYIYRVPLPDWALAMLKRHRSRIIFDFDDALDEPETTRDGIMAPLRERILRRGLCNGISAATVTVTSNERNADFVRKQGGQAVVVPTCVDVSQYRYRDRRELVGGRGVLGWIGTPSTARYLELIERPLQRISALHPVSVRLVGAGAKPLRSVDAEVRDWALETETEEIRRFDVGLMPMPDSPWTRGKAGLKALQYGASGAPTVASWTPTNVEILGEGDGTVLCRSDGEWVDALDRLLRDGQLRAELGARAFRRVSTRYSVDLAAPKLVGLICRPSVRCSDPCPP